MTEGEEERLPGSLQRTFRRFPSKLCVISSYIGKAVSCLNMKYRVGTRIFQCEKKTSMWVAGLRTCRWLKLREAARGERLFLSRCCSELELWNLFQSHSYHGRRQKWRCFHVWCVFNSVKETGVIRAQTSEKVILCRDRMRRAKMSAE